MGGACYPEGYDPEGGSSLMCGARTPGPLGLRDAADPDATAVMGRSPGPMGLNDAAACMADAGSGSVAACFGPVVDGSTSDSADHEMFILEVEVLPGSAPPDSWLETTAENLARFAHEKRTDWPGWVMDGVTVVEHLREFGADSFYVMPGKGKGKEGKRYLVFKGNPRKPGKYLGLRRMIRGNGPYSFANPKVVQMGFGMKNALRAGAKGTVIAFVVVAGIDVVSELLKDEVSLRRLGVQIAIDVVNLLISGLAAAATTSLIVAGTAAIGVAFPVAGLVATAIFVGIGVSAAVNWADERFRVSEMLHKKAEEIEARVDTGLRRFLMQMEWCARNPYGCFGGW
jgi:hypothetical protein